ncbi:hypothetical protein ACTA57_004566 [Vibrio parahaemolyticus]|nr:hypothetical protein [Vibrio parahaemolyticus]EJG1564467.1 hypothetical protein [Vibrio parahaemolyticus]
MEHHEISSLVSDIKNKESFNDFISFWLSNQTRIGDISTLYTFDEVGNESPVEPLIGSYSDEKFFVRSIFSKKNVYFLNKAIWLEIMGQGGKDVPVDCVLSFDTQFGNYAVKYIKDPKFRDTEVGRSFHQLLMFVFKNKINPEFSFYLQENYANYISGHEKEIKNQIYALVKIVDSDKDWFIQTGEIRLSYGAEKLNSRVDEILGFYENKETLNHFNDMEHLQTSIASLILKAALLRRTKLDKNEQVKELVVFCHKKVSAILSLELYVLSQWLMGKKIEFFDPINGGDNLHTLPQKIHGMAWDFMLLRHVERYCSVFQHDRYSLAYYSSFDRRMIEMSDLYKNRGCLFPPKNLFDRFLMIPELDLNAWYAEVIGDDLNGKIFNSDMWEYRDSNRPRPETLASLRRSLEFDLVKSYSRKKS